MQNLPKTDIEKKGIEWLKKSLDLVPIELNELDWKVNISDDKDKFARHLSAFSNQTNGGFLVFGVDDMGVPFGVTQEECKTIITSIANRIRSSIEPPNKISHFIYEYKGVTLLLIYIYESTIKPVKVKSGNIYDCYLRSGGQTRLMTKDEFIDAVKRSHGVKFEEDLAKESLGPSEVIEYIDFKAYYRLLKTPIPESLESILDFLSKDNLINEVDGKYNITNLGALLLAKNINEFPNLSRKAVRVIKYKGKDRLNSEMEQVGVRGYAAGFEGLIDYVSKLLPSNEVIEKALRQNVPMYPIKALRELIANALIHQDLEGRGVSPMIEIFEDRIEITNPGRPLIDTLRFIDHPPKSRNEKLASLMRRFRMCEERGMGIDRVVASCALYQLPAPNFLSTDSDTKVILYAYKDLNRMDKEDKIRACFQLCVLNWVSNLKTTNETVRQRFDIKTSNYPMASRIINDTIKKGLIKIGNPENTSPKYTYYTPFWV